MIFKYTEYPPKIQFVGSGQICKCDRKAFFYFLEGDPEFLYLHLLIKDLPGSIQTNDSPCIVLQPLTETTGWQYSQITQIRKFCNLQVPREVQFRTLSFDCNVI